MIGELRRISAPAIYDRSGDDLTERGLYLDMPAWGHQVFDVSVADERRSVRAVA